MPQGGGLIVKVGCIRDGADTKGIRRGAGREPIGRGAGTFRLFFEGWELTAGFRSGEASCTLFCTLWNRGISEGIHGINADVYVWVPGRESAGLL